jgi:ubiquinone biosynthesis protein
MWPLVRQARFLGRYREIAQVLGGHGFGYLLEQLGLISLLSLPRRVVLRVPPTPPLGSAVRLREALIALGPTFVKLGQLLSTRPDLLPVEFTTELSKLQDTVPPFPAEVAISTIERELGRPLNELFSSFEREPLAAASLGQVHAAVLPNGAKVAVKVQRPDIATRIHTDLAIIGDLAALAQERLSWAAQYDLVGLAWEFSSVLRAELDYRREGRNAERFRDNFQGSALVYVPKIYWDYTSPTVLTSERLYGAKINDIAALERAGIDRRELARNSLMLILQEIFRDGFFHSDPHPGNFFALPNAVIGVVDFGQVGSLDRTTTRGLLLLLAAVAAHDTHGVLRALEGLELVAHRDVTPAMRRDVAQFTERFVDHSLSELSARETIEELIALLRRHHIRLPGTMATLLKALIMMEGTGLQLDPQLDVFGIARPYAQRAIAEQFAPDAMGTRLAEESRSLGEIALGLPHQASDLLQRINDGELRIQTRELELRRVAGALIGAANRLAIGLVLAALILGLAMVSIAIALGDWQGLVPRLLLIFGSLGVVVLGVLLGFALLRGRE